MCRRLGTKLSGQGWRVEALPMMTRHHRLQAPAQLMTAVASRRWKISRRSSSGSSDSHASASSMSRSSGSIRTDAGRSIYLLCLWCEVRAWVSIGWKHDWKCWLVVPNAYIFFENRCPNWIQSGEDRLQLLKLESKIIRFRTSTIVFETHSQS